MTKYIQKRIEKGFGEGSCYARKNLIASEPIERILMGDCPMPEEQEKEEDCEDCRLSAGVLVSNEICRTLKERSDIDCKRLVQDVIDKRITPKEYMDTLIKHTEEIDDTTNVEILREIRRLMHNG